MPDILLLREEYDKHNYHQVAGLLFTEGVSALKISLILEPDRPVGRLMAGDTQWAQLWLGGSVDTANAKDETSTLGTPRIEDTADGQRITVEAASSVWVHKQFVIEVHPTYAAAWVEVKGQGEVTKVRLFGGSLDGVAATGRIMSRRLFHSVFSPGPVRCERWVRSAAMNQALEVGGSAVIGQDNWFFTPPPTCFAMGLAVASRASMRIPETSWMTMGCVARPGENHFTAFEYAGGDGAFALDVRYGAHLRVGEAFRSPAILLSAAHGTPYEALANYRELYATWLEAAPAAPKIADWWTRPMFCGWGAQFAEAFAGNGAAAAMATQDRYDRWLSHLQAQRINVKTVVIDDKWQAQYGLNEADPAKWPDLPAWIRQRHANGQRVLLWLKLWDPEGLPERECIRNRRGQAIAADPTNPAYERRLRRSVWQMLGTSGYDADGFKLDFSGRIPLASGLRQRQPVAGLELQKRLLSIIYSEAKRVKPDALVIAHTPHPYFADVVDMIRLNDVNKEHEVVAQMTHRAGVVRAVCPDHPIDADNWPMTGRKQWRQYMAMSHKLGVPALYFATHITPDEALTSSDYRLIRQVWA